MLEIILDPQKSEKEECLDSISILNSFFEILISFFDLVFIELIFLYKSKKQIESSEIFYCYIGILNKIYKLY